MKLFSLIKLLFVIYLCGNVIKTQENTQAVEEDLSQKGELEGLVVFIRHGARTPAMEDYYPEQWGDVQKGHLTEKGQQQLIDLGTRMKKTYIDQFKSLPQEFDKKYVAVKFAFISRCLISLLGFLKGMYPDIYNHQEITSENDLRTPSKDLGFSFDFNDYAEFQRDLLFRANDKKNCKLIKHIQEKKVNSKKFQAIFKFFKEHPLMQSIIEKLDDYRKSVNPEYNEKTELKSMFHLKEIYDSYLMNRKHEKPVPAWNEKEVHLLQMQYEHFFYKFFGFHEAKKIEASEFFKQLNEITDQIYDVNREEKIYIYSGTKTNIAIFISSLLTKEQIADLGDKKIAPLSHYVAFEFWKDENGEPNIRIKYGEDTLSLKQCKKQTSCTLREFKILVKTKIYRNLETICDIDIQK